MDVKSVSPVVASTGAATVQGADPGIAAQRRAFTDAVRAVDSAGLFGQDNELTYVLDRGSREAVARVINRKTKQLVMQVPAEYILRIAQQLQKPG